MWILARFFCGRGSNGQKVCGRGWLVCQGPWGAKLLRDLHLENWGGRILLSAGLSFWEALPAASAVPPELLSPSCWEIPAAG